MPDVFFDELGVPEPKYYLDVGSDLHVQMMVTFLVSFEKVSLEENLYSVIAYWDTGTTLEEIVRKTATILNSVPVQSAIYGNGKAAEQIVSAITGSLI